MNGDVPGRALPEDPEARAWIVRLGLSPHPEGGWYAQTWRDASAAAQLGPRGCGTSIYFLLSRGERSHWHRVDATEIWHYYGGAPLRLETAADAAGPVEAGLLGLDWERGQAPQRIVRAGTWQAAASVGAWTLVGCTVSPGFTFEGFELAPPGWAPGIGE